jgi:hypothetical protein
MTVSTKPADMNLVIRSLHYFVQLKTEETYPPTCFDTTSFFITFPME